MQVLKSKMVTVSNGGCGKGLKGAWLKPNPGQKTFPHAVGLYCTARVNCLFCSGVRRKLILTRFFGQPENYAPPLSSGGLFLIYGACSELYDIRNIYNSSPLEHRGARLVLCWGYWRVRKVNLLSSFPLTRTSS